MNWFITLCLLCITLSLISIANSLLRISKPTIIQMQKIDKQDYLDKLYGRNDKK